MCSVGGLAEDKEDEIEINAKEKDRKGRVQKPNS